MPPKKKFSKEKIVETAFKIARDKGFDHITARSIAKKLKSSVVPIYHNFKDIEEVKKEVIKKIMYLYGSFAEMNFTENKFLNIGIASIKFANEYSQLFNDIILNNSKYLDDYEEDYVDEIVEVMKQEPELSYFDKNTLKETFFKIRIFQTGLSTMIANGLLPKDFDEEKQIELLNSFSQDLLISLKQKK
jgi:AcrR family transcriptional regulator